MDILGVEFKQDLPAGKKPVEVIAIFKVLNEEDTEGFPYQLYAVSSDGLSAWEAEGMCRWAGRIFGQDIESEREDGL